MAALYVCSLSRLHETVAATGARHLVTLINVGTPVERPAEISADRHLYLGMSDIVAPMDQHVLPGEAHIRELLRFVQEWDRQAPLLIHCWAGISRSTAAAFIAACALSPGRDEAAIADALRLASPSATPNAKLVALADAVLGRDGRMVTSIARIGRGADAFEGAPFRLDLS